MCYTAVLFSKKRLGHYGYNIVDAMLNFMSQNPHGYAIKIVTQNDDVKLLRTLNANDFKRFIAKNKIEIEKAKLVHLHFRLATAGAINIDNVHLWEKDKWHFSHNGSTAFDTPRFVYDPVTKTLKTELTGKSDSLKLFEKLENITPENVKKVIDDYGVYGIYLFTKFNDIIAVSQTKPIKAYYLRKNNWTLVILSSGELEFKKTIKKDIKAYGITWTYKKVENIIPDSVRILKTTFKNELLYFENMVLKKRLKIRGFEHHYNYNYYDYDYYYKA